MQSLRIVKLSMDTGQLEAFVAVAELLSFSRAAEHLHLTQSAVSKRVATLENDLDTVLFERFGQSIKLSEAGKTLLPDAQDILAKVQEMRQHSDIGKHHISGKLRVATSHYIGLYHLPGILQRFVQKYPEVQLDMHFAASETVCEGVGQGLFDIAVATLPHSGTANITTTPLWQDELVIMFSQNHSMASVEELNIKELSLHAAILPEKGTFTRNIIDEVFNTSGIKCPLAFTTNYLETIKVMVAAGLGWSVLPKIMLNPDLTHRPLVATQASRQLGTILHKNKVITPALSAFITELTSTE